MLNNLTKSSFALPETTKLKISPSDYEGQNISVPSLEFHDYDTVIKKVSFHTPHSNPKIDEKSVPTLQCLEIKGNKTAQENDDEVEDDEREEEQPRYIPIGKIESGQYGSVSEIRDSSTFQKIAVKENKSVKYKDITMYEAELHSTLKHENIVQFIDCLKSDTTVAIRMELIPGGSLHSLLMREGRGFSEQVTSHYMAQVVDVFCYLHGNEVVHLDLKGKNLLINEYSAKCYLCDFGCARRVSDGLLYKQLGTVNYMAPEVIKANEGNPYDGKKADVWSIGCLAIEMLIGEPPYFRMNQNTILFRVGKNTLNPEIPRDASNKCKQFIESCVRRNPIERAGIEELKEHAFVQRRPMKKTKRRPFKFCYKPCNDELVNHDDGNKNESYKETDKNNNSYNGKIETACAQHYSFKAFKRPVEVNSDNIDDKYSYCFSKDMKNPYKEFSETNEENNALLTETEHVSFALTKRH